MGGWPVVKGNSWDEKSWTWQQSVKEFRKRGYSTDYIFDFSVGTDLKNSTHRIIDVRNLRYQLIVDLLIINYTINVFYRLIKQLWDWAVNISLKASRIQLWAPIIAIKLTWPYSMVLSDSVPRKRCVMCWNLNSPWQMWEYFDEKFMIGWCLWQFNADFIAERGEEKRNCVVQSDDHQRSASEISLQQLGKWHKINKKYKYQV